MFDAIRILLAGIGAALILAALTYVTLLIGVLVNVMIVLLSGPLVDKVLKQPASTGPTS